jgi:hypothetical protein
MKIKTIEKVTIKLEFLDIFFMKSNHFFRQGIVRLNENAKGNPGGIFPSIARIPLLADLAIT